MTISVQADPPGVTSYIGDPPPKGMFRFGAPAAPPAGESPDERADHWLLRAEIALNNPHAPGSYDYARACAELAAVWQHRAELAWWRDCRRQDLAAIPLTYAGVTPADDTATGD